MTTPLDKLNSWEERYEHKEKELTKLLRLVLRNFPRDELIKEMMKRKIIKIDWNEDKLVYKPSEGYPTLEELK